jgi:hypothetical protein
MTYKVKMILPVNHMRFFLSPEGATIAPKKAREKAVLVVCSVWPGTACVWWRPRLEVPPVATAKAHGCLRVDAPDEAGNRQVIQ